MIRDKEIERLVKYANAMGTKVVFSNAPRPGDNAEWYIDNSQITIYTKKNLSKTDTILSLVHEIGHVLDFIHENDRVEDKNLEKALDAQDRNDAKRKHLKKILDVERRATQYWHTIYKETDLKIPLWKVDLSIEFDVWQYEYLYENGKWPNKKVRAKKRTALTVKYKI